MGGKGEGTGNGVPPCPPPHKRTLRTHYCIIENVYTIFKMNMGRFNSFTLSMKKPQSSVQNNVDHDQLMCQCSVCVFIGLNTVIHHGP